jgi:hypothetical protein
VDLRLASFNPENFSDRINRSAAAKAESVDRHRSRPGPGDPRLIEKAAERLKTHEARLARQAERQRLKQEEQERQAESRRLQEEQEILDALARETQVEAEAQAAREARRNRAALMASNLAGEKSLRDARYAARKARQKEVKKR